jgi:hypothetical protein
MASAAHAQTNANAFKFTVTPTNKTIMVVETTNLLTVAISNLSTTNTTVDPDPVDPTKSVTNVLVTSFFSNVVVSATDGGSIKLKLLDDGKAPDQTASNAVYSVNWITPSNYLATNITLSFICSGIDLSATNETGDLTYPVVSNVTKMVYTIVPRPQNDRFTNAFKVESLGETIIATNNYASLETGEPQHGKVATEDASVWWKWSSPVTTNVLIDTAGSSFNPVLAVYTGSEVKKLTEVISATDDATFKLKAHVNFTATAGVTYRIAVAGQNTNGVGDIRLRIAPGTTFDTNGPSVAIKTPQDGALFTTNMVAFSGIASDIKPNDSGVGKVYLQVNKLTPVLMSGQESWSGTLNLPAGTNTINAFALDYAGNTGTVQSITVKYINPTNDWFIAATLLTKPSGLDLAINGRATIEPGEPLHSGNEGGHSIWYIWTAPDNGQLFLSTTNSDFDTLLDLYTGDQLTNLVSLASNDDAFDGSLFSELTQYVVSNQVYYISVDGYGGVSGRVFLSYSFAKKSPPQLYALKIDSSDGGRVTPASAYFPTNSTVQVTAIADTDYTFVGWKGSITSTNNPLLVEMIGDRNLTAWFRFSNYTESFESGGFNPSLDWSTPNGTSWVVQTNLASDGNWAARSGAIADGQRSSLRLVAANMAGSAHFDYFVSSELGWDFLEFHLNGNLMKQWSGTDQQSWKTYSFTVPAGTNTLEWFYLKDAHFSEGLDAGFIDNVYLPMGQLVPSISANLLSGNRVQIEVQGKFYQYYVIEASSNLLNWVPISTNRSANGVIDFEDPAFNANSKRFYRATTAGN